MIYMKEKLNLLDNKIWKSYSTLTLKKINNIMTATISSWGNFQGVRFSKNVMKELHLSIGDKVKVLVKNMILMNWSGSYQKTVNKILGIIDSIIQ